MPNVTWNNAYHCTCPVFGITGVFWPVTLDENNAKHNTTQSGSQGGRGHRLLEQWGQ